MRALVLFWLDRKRGKGEPRKFSRLWINGTPENELPAKFTFTRQAVYHGFSRLEEKGLLRRVDGKYLTYEFVDGDRARSAAIHLWWNVVPIQPALKSREKEMHKRLMASLKESSDCQFKLRPQLKRELAPDIVENHVFDMQFKNATSVKEMLILEEAEKLEKKARVLFDQDHFVVKEEKMKTMPSALRVSGLKNWFSAAIYAKE